MRFRILFGLLALALGASLSAYVRFDAQTKIRSFVFIGDGKFNYLSQRNSRVSFARSDLVCKVDTDPHNAPKEVGLLASPYCSMGFVEWAELLPFDSDTAGVFVFDKQCRLKYFGSYRITNKPAQPQEYCRRAGELDGKHDNVTDIIAN